MTGASEGTLRSRFSSTTGGVMTDEAGAITGDLELVTRIAPNGGIEAMVCYAGAKDLYTVSGSPARVASENPEEGEHEQAHSAVLARLTTPGPSDAGNEQPTDLRD